MLRKSDLSRGALLSSHVYLENDQTNLVIFTWRVTFDHIRRTRPTAASRLSVMSFFDHRSIPESLLADGTDDYLEGDLQILHNFDLVSSKPQGREYEMHPLVTFAVKSWLNASGQHEYWHERSLCDILSALPDSGEFEDWAQWQILYPHVQLALLSYTRSRETKLNKAGILDVAADYLFEQDLFSAAETLQRNALLSEHLC